MYTQQSDEITIGDFKIALSTTPDYRIPSLEKVVLIKDSAGKETIRPCAGATIPIKIPQNDDSVYSSFGGLGDIDKLMMGFEYPPERVFLLRQSSPAFKELVLENIKDKAILASLIGNCALSQNGDCSPFKYEVEHLSDYRRNVTCIFEIEVVFKVDETFPTHFYPYVAINKYFAR